MRDLNAYQFAMAHGSNQSVDAQAHTPQDDMVLGRHYVVLQPMSFPADLYGANSVTFIVPKGVERPKGNPGHSAVHDMNQRTY